MERVSISSTRVPRLVILVFFIAGLILLLRIALIYGLPAKFHGSLSEFHAFDIRELSIQAEWPLKEETILSYLPKLKGKSLLVIQPTEIYSRLNEKPWVKEVSVKKEYPDRLSIRIETKKARAVTFVAGVPHYLDSRGTLIEKVTNGTEDWKDLPFINGFTEGKWKMEEILNFHQELKSQLGKLGSISEIQLGVFPQLKVYLAHPKLEILFSHENALEQLPYLLTLLSGPPSQMRQIHKINLVFPKKAVVTHPVSH